METTPYHTIERRTVTLPEAAAMLGMARSSAYDLVRREKFPCPVIKAGKRVYVSRSAIERLLDPDPPLPECEG